MTDKKSKLDDKIDDCCKTHTTIGDFREPATALPKTDEDAPKLHDPSIGHRPAGQTIHD